MVFILLLALILFGPKRLPEIARQIGKFVAEFKRASNDFKYQLQAEIDKAEVAGPAASRQSPQQSSPSAPALLPPAESSAPSSTESEHERLMRTARMAYEAQAFTLRPPEPPRPSTPTTGASEMPVEHTAAAIAGERSPEEPVSLPSAAGSEPANDSAGHRSS